MAQLLKRTIAAHDCVECVSKRKKCTVSDTILFIHGMCGGAWYFKNWMNAVEEQEYRAIAVNLSGHHCPRAHLRTSVNDYVRDVAEILLEIGPAYVVGHSMGGLITQRLVDEVPHLLKGVVLVSPAPPRGVRFPMSVYRQILPLLIHKKAISSGLSFVTGFSLEVNEADIIRLALNRVKDPKNCVERFVPESGRAVFEMTRGAIAVKDDGASRVPMHIISAEYDLLTPVKMCQAIARKHGASHRSYVGHAHMLMIEPGWEAVISDIVCWCKMENARSVACLN